MEAGKKTNLDNEKCCVSLFLPMKSEIKAQPNRPAPLNMPSTPTSAAACIVVIPILSIASGFAADKIAIPLVTFINSKNVLF